MKINITILFNKKFSFPLSYMSTWANFVNCGGQEFIKMTGMLTKTPEQILILF